MLEESPTPSGGAFDPARASDQTGMAGVCRPERGRPPKNLHPLDVHYQKLQREMLATFQTLKIAA